MILKLQKLEQLINSELSSKIHNSSINNSSLMIFDLCILLESSELINFSSFFKFKIIYLFKDPSLLIFFCSCKIPYNKASAEGGQPGT